MTVVVGALFTPSQQATTTVTTAGSKSCLRAAPGRVGGLRRRGQNAHGVSASLTHCTDSRRKTAPARKKKKQSPTLFVWGLFTSDEFWPFSFLRASADLVAKMLRAVLLVVAAASASAFAPAAVLPRAAQSECPATCTSSPKHWICAEADWTRLQRRSSGRAGAAASRMGACGCML